MDDLYGGTNRYLRKVADRMNIKTTFVDATNPENVEKAIQENTKVCFPYKLFFFFVIRNPCQTPDANYKIILLRTAGVGGDSHKSHFEAG